MLTLEEEKFLSGVGRIRTRAIITTAAVAIVSLLLIVFFAGFGMGALRPVGTAVGGVQELTSQVQQLTTMGKASIVLFLTTLFIGIVGLVMLVLAYERQASHLVRVVRRIAGPPTGSEGH